VKPQPAPQERFSGFKARARRFSFAVVIIGAFALMLLGKADIVVVREIRMALSDLFAPVMDMLAYPGKYTADAVENVKEFSDIRAENTRLREENAKLHKWERTARYLSAENKSLRAMLNYIPKTSQRHITARVVGDDGSPFTQSLLVTAGHRENVRKGMAVLSNEGLVGQIIEVGRNTARVLLITDINSRVPVRLEKSRARAVMYGANDLQPSLSFVANGVSVAQGDRVVTSGHGLAFPPGLPVGVVASVADGLPRVKPFFQPHLLEYVQIVDYGLEGFFTAEELEAENPTQQPATGAEANLP
jgi:rod shape-determining protein MreC